jgi:cobalt-zinc-cadmium efflux system protein
MMWKEAEIRVTSPESEYPLANSPRTAERFALKAALILTSSFMIVEFVGGLLTNSLVLIADAGHMLTDAAALGLSMFALWFSSRPATPAKTYGFFRVEILAALVNGASLIVLSLLIFSAAYYRIFRPPAVNSQLMLLIASIGLLVNLVTAHFLRRCHDTSLNVKGAFLHVVGDAASSLGAITAGLMMWWKGWLWADPLASALVGVLILYSSWHLVKDSVDILLEGTPAHINLAEVKDELCKVESVDSIHDLHIWTLTSGIHAMSCHVVLCGEKDRHEILKELSEIMRQRFAVDHTTIQLEEINLQHRETHSCH